MATQSMLIQRYQQHLAALNQAPGKTVIRRTFRRVLTTGSLLPILRMIFDDVATEYVLPDEGLAAGGAHYWLTPAGGWDASRRAPGAAMRTPTISTCCCPAGG